MALSFPLSTADFFSGLAVESVTWDLGESLGISRTGGGAVLTYDDGPRLWRGTVYLRPGYHDDISEQAAKLDLIRYSGRPFFAYNPVRAGPRYDPSGIVLAASTPTIGAIASNNRDLTISGLPSSYVLSAGDLLSFTYLSSPTRYAMHRVAVGAIADTSGSATVELSSYIRTGAAAGASITLIKPFIKAVYIPGSFGFTSMMSGAGSYGASQINVTAGPSFQFIQTLGA